MITILKDSPHYSPHYSVLRRTESGSCERLIGSYESEKEARFIAKKAEKMEKMSIMFRKIKEDPSLEGRITITSIVLGDVYYDIVPAVFNKLSACYTNGVSNILHFMDDRNPHEKRIAKKELSTNSFLSFKEFIMLREANVKLSSRWSKDWDLSDTEVQDG
jgi:hypothetical protein